MNGEPPGKDTLCFSFRSPHLLISEVQGFWVFQASPNYIIGRRLAFSNSVRHLCHGILDDDSMFVHVFRFPVSLVLAKSICICFHSRSFPCFWFLFKSRSQCSSHCSSQCSCAWRANAKTIEDDRGHDRCWWAQQGLIRKTQRNL